MGRPLFVKLSIGEQMLVNNAVNKGGQFAEVAARFATLKALEVPESYWDQVIPYKFHGGYTRLSLWPTDGLLDRYILVSGNPHDMIVWGWMWGYEGMTEEFAAGDKCVVPGERLNDILLLRDEIYKQLNCSRSSTADIPNGRTGVRLPARAPARFSAESTNSAVSRECRFAWYEIETFLKEKSELMAEVTRLALEDKARRKTKDPRRTK